MAQQLRLRVSETIAHNIDDNGIYASLPTEGDGACGLHALFGSVTTAGVVFAANARNVAKNALLRYWDGNAASMPNSETLNRVLIALWSEYSIPCARADTSRDTEADIFFSALTQSSQNDIFISIAEVAERESYVAH